MRLESLKAFWRGIDCVAASAQSLLSGGLSTRRQGPWIYHALSYNSTTPSGTRAHCDSRFECSTAWPLSQSARHQSLTTDLVDG